MPSKFDPNKHHRRSIRLPRYDYSQVGAYYVTVVVWHRECCLGRWLTRKWCYIDMGKSFKRFWKFPDLKGLPIWQRNYYEHIIRGEKDLQNKTDYIETRPLLWDKDDENPKNIEM